MNYWAEFGHSTALVLAGLALGSILPQIPTAAAVAVFCAAVALSALCLWWGS